MQGLVFDGPGAIAFRTDLPAPQLACPEDAIVAVRLAGLCGSDLHPYEGRESARAGVVPGHEAVGEVTAVGEAVTRIAVGQTVIVPFTTSCGTCGACRGGLSARCARGELFGWGAPEDPLRVLHGAQAEQVRVPLADGTLVEVPDGPSDAEALLLTDNFPTGWHAAERADVVPGEAVAVVGLGAVGLCAVTAAQAMGAGVVVGVDPVESRRERAEAMGVATAHPDDAPGMLEQVAAGAVASVIEAAGTASAQRLALGLLRPGGTLSLISVQTSGRFAFTPIEAYDANLTVRAGRAPVRSILDRLLPRVSSGEVVVPAETVITHGDLPLSEGPEAYRRFAAREPGMVKVAFIPLHG